MQAADSANSVCPSMREPSRRSRLSQEARDPREIPIVKEQLVGALDPVAAVFFHARSDDPNGDLKVCDQTVPVFDGGWRFDLVLTPKRKVPLRKKAETGYSSHAVVCRVKFKPISGYAPDDPNIRLMSHTDAIEVWFVSLPGTDMYVPYHLLLPTDSAYCQRPQHHCELKGTGKQLRSLEPKSRAITLGLKGRTQHKPPPKLRFLSEKPLEA